MLLETCYLRHVLLETGVTWDMAVLLHVIHFDFMLVFNVHFFLRALWSKINNLVWNILTTTASCSPQQLKKMICNGHSDHCTVTTAGSFALRNLVLCFFIRVNGILIFRQVFLILFTYQTCLGILTLLLSRNIIKSSLGMRSHSLLKEAGLKTEGDPDLQCQSQQTLLPG